MLKHMFLNALLTAGLVTYTELLSETLKNHGSRLKVEHYDRLISAVGASGHTKVFPIRSRDESQNYAWKKPKLVLAKAVPKRGEPNTQFQQ